ncbi:MAG: lipoyl(octanoyl) transferase LipB [Desulfuromonadales bacterium]|nr:lipoyl(octanoyl) transferase LipB [Desulfuromonadales bacterium]
MRQTFFTLRPGRLPYRTGLALQERLLGRETPTDGDLLLLLEHPPTITLGRGADKHHLLSSPDQLEAAGIDICQAARGGDITYHGPGQLVGYPLVDLTRRGKDLHRFLRDLEELLIRVLGQWDIDAGRRRDKTGVWVADRKIASIGIGVRRWITWHGFALNLDTDLAGFTHIVPCGLQGVQMTSMAELLGSAPPRLEVEDALIRTFSEIFNSEHAGTYGN